MVVALCTGAQALDTNHLVSQVEKLLRINDDLEARVAALEAQMVAVQAEVTAQQTEVTAVQKEVVVVEGQVEQVGSGLTNLTTRYTATVGLVEELVTSLTTTITRVNQTEVRVGVVEEGVTAVNTTVGKNVEGLVELEAATDKDRQLLTSTTKLANTTAIQLTTLNTTVVANKGAVEDLEVHLTTTITRVNQTEVRVGRVEEGVTAVNTTATKNTEGLVELEAATARDRKTLSSTTALANLTAHRVQELNTSIASVAEIVGVHHRQLDALNATIEAVDKNVHQHHTELEGLRTALSHVEDEEMPELKQDIKKNKREITENASELDKNEYLIKHNNKNIIKNKNAISENGDSVQEIQETLKEVDHSIRENKGAISENDDSIEAIRGKMKYVKTEVVEYCGYQSSWDKQEATVTYEYLTVSRNTVGSGTRDLPTPLPTQPSTSAAPQPTSPVSLVSRPPHHRISGLAPKTGVFRAPMEGTYRVSFQVGHLETGSHNSRTSIFIRKNGLKDETVHLETRAATEETDVIGHEALVTLAREDTMDVYVDETSDKLYGIMLCVALV